MKKVLTMVTAIILTASLSAFATGNDKPVHRQGSYELSFTKLQVEDGIDIMLVEGTSRSIDFKGAEADIDQVDWNIRDGVMKISSKKGSLKGKVQLVVSVSNLTEIYVKDGAEVSSEGKLHSPSLKVYLDGDSFISIKSTGDIKVVKLEDTDMEVKTVVGNVVFG